MSFCYKLVLCSLDWFKLFVPCWILQILFVSVSEKTNYHGHFNWLWWSWLIFPFRRTFQFGYFTYINSILEILQILKNVYWNIAILCCFFLRVTTHIDERRDSFQEKRNQTKKFCVDKRRKLTYRKTETDICTFWFVTFSETLMRFKKTMRDRCIYTGGELSKPKHA